MTETTPRYIRDLPLARAVDRRARQQRQRDAAIDTLRRHAEGREPHLYYESCPTSNYPAQRDVRCSVCLALIDTETQP